MKTYYFNVFGPNSLDMSSTLGLCYFMWLANSNDFWKLIWNVYKACGFGHFQGSNKIVGFGPWYFHFQDK